MQGRSTKCQSSPMSTRFWRASKQKPLPSSGRKAAGGQSGPAPVRFPCRGTAPAARQTRTRQGPGNSRLAIEGQGLVGAVHEFLLVGTQPGALEQQRLDLALEFPYRPELPDAFDFVEGTL